jgi:predicted acyl esterase
MIPPKGPFPDSFDEATDADTLPVDEDTDGRLLNAAIGEHRGLVNPGAMPYRDSKSTTFGLNYFDEVNPSAHLKEIRESGVAIYNIGHWNNWLITGSTHGFVNFSNPKKLALTNTSMGTNDVSGGKAGFDISIEHLRWFDYWLKGIDNGIMDEPLVFYEVANTGERRQADQWPPTAKEKSLYLGQGVLSSTPPQEGEMSFKVDYALTREDRAVKGLQFTSDPFSDDCLLIGHAQADLTVETTAEDGDLLAYIQDIAPDGTVRDVTEGRLRASHRAEHKSPFDNLGLPWHRTYNADILPMKPGKAERLRFSFLPVAWKIETGHSLRLLITGAIPQRSAGLDLFNETPRQDPVPTQTVKLGVSRLILPFEGKAQ